MRVDTIGIHQQLMNKRFDETIELDVYINQFGDLIAKLRMRGRTIQDTEAVEMLLASLPRRFDAIISIIVDSGNLNWARVREKLISHEARSKTRDEEEEPKNQAMLTKSRCQDNGKSDKNYQNKNQHQN